MTPPRGRMRWLSGAMPDRHARRVEEAATVWIGTCGTATQGIAALRPTPDDEREALARPASERDAFLARRALLRGFVAASCGVAADRVVIAADRDGVPRLGPPLDKLFVSSASREGWVAVALASAPLGVDIEVATAPAEPAWNILSPSERERLAGLPEPERWAAFLRIWTAKEAYLKAIGLGLSREPSEIAIGASVGEAFTVHDRDRPVAVRAAEGHAVTLEGTRLLAACVVLADVSA